MCKGGKEGLKKAIGFFEEQMKAFGFGDVRLLL